MKRIISLVLIVFMFFSMNVPLITAEFLFTDVTTEDWFYNAAYKACELKIMNGTSADTFSPYDAVSRAMAVQVLYNISGDEHEYSPYFTDVAENAWYAKAVCWAKDKGIANGVSQTRFDPSALMTREQLACFIDRYLEIFELEVTSSPMPDYADMKNVSEWAYDSVTHMYEYGIMTPRVYDFFYPEVSVSRAEFATFALNMIGEQNIAEDTSVHIQLVYAKVASAVLGKGSSINTHAAIHPESATDDTIIYTSSAPAVASVDEKGEVTALSAGVATITIESRDGHLKAYCQITVSPDPALTPAVNNSYTSSLDTSGMTPMGRVIDPNKPMVAITYDDGPHRTYTTQILNTLEQYNAVATFFELGNRAVNCSDILQREVALGCEVANHSYSHPNLATLSAGRVYSQINDTKNIIYNGCGVTPTLVRPPYGSHNATVRANVNAPVILWSIDTLDWKYRDASYVTSVIKNQVTDGSIILMHSLYASTAKATEIIVPWLISRGYQLVTVSELARARGVQMQNGKVYTAFYK